MTMQPLLLGSMESGMDSHFALLGATGPPSDGGDWFQVPQGNAGHSFATLLQVALKGSQQAKMQPLEGHADDAPPVASPVMTWLGDAQMVAPVVHPNEVGTLKLGAVVEVLGERRSVGGVVLINTGWTAASSSTVRDGPWETSFDATPPRGDVIMVQARTTLDVPSQRDPWGDSHVTDSRQSGVEEEHARTEERLDAARPIPQVSLPFEQELLEASQETTVQGGSSQGEPFSVGVSADIEQVPIPLLAGDRIAPGVEKAEIALSERPTRDFERGSATRPGTTEVVTTPLGVPVRVAGGAGEMAFDVGTTEAVTTPLGTTEVVTTPLRAPVRVAAGAGEVALDVGTTEVVTTPSGAPEVVTTPSGTTEVVTTVLGATEVGTTPQGESAKGGGSLSTQPIVGSTESEAELVSVQQTGLAVRSVETKVREPMTGLSEKAVSVPLLLGQMPAVISVEMTSNFVERVVFVPPTQAPMAVEASHDLGQSQVQIRRHLDIGQALGSPAAVWAKETSGTDFVVQTGVFSVREPHVAFETPADQVVSAPVPVDLDLRVYEDVSHAASVRTTSAPGMLVLDGTDKSVAVPEQPIRIVLLQGVIQPPGQQHGEVTAFALPFKTILPLIERAGSNDSRPTVPAVVFPADGPAQGAEVILTRDESCFAETSPQRAMHPAATVPAVKSAPLLSRSEPLQTEVPLSNEAGVGNSADATPARRDDFTRPEALAVEPQTDDLSRRTRVVLATERSYIFEGPANGVMRPAWIAPAVKLSQLVSSPAWPDVEVPPSTEGNKRGPTNATPASVQNQQASPQRQDEAVLPELLESRPRSQLTDTTPVVGMRPQGTRMVMLRPDVAPVIARVSQSPVWLLSASRNQAQGAQGAGQPASPAQVSNQAEVVSVQKQFSGLGAAVSQVVTTSVVFERQEPAVAVARPVASDLTLSPRVSAEAAAGVAFVSSESATTRNPVSTSTGEASTMSTHSAGSTLLPEAFETGSRRQSVEGAFQPESGRLSPMASALSASVEPVADRGRHEALARVPAESSSGVRWKPVLEQILGEVRNASVSEQGEMRLQLEPAHLGRLRMQIAVADGRVSAHIITQSGEVKSLLERHLPQLNAALGEQGLRVHEVRFTLAGAGEDVASSFSGSGRERSALAQEHRAAFGSDADLRSGYDDSRRPLPERWERWPGRRNSQIDYRA